MRYTFGNKKQGEDFCSVSPFPQSLSATKQLMQRSSSWLEFSCFIGTVLSLETMADCFCCAQKDLVLAGRLPVNKLHILCKKHACALFRPDSHVPSTGSLIPACRISSRACTEPRRLESTVEAKPGEGGSS